MSSEDGEGTSAQPEEFPFSVLVYMKFIWKTTEEAAR
jgi:hypothetical protein